MECTFAIVAVPDSFLYAKPGRTGEVNPSEMTDEVLSGWALQVLKKNDGWAYVRTFYGYEGWIRETDIRAVTRSDLESRQDKTRFMQLRARSADLHAEPTVQGCILETLLQDSLVELLDSRKDWSLIKSSAGVSGWVSASALKPRKDCDGFLLEKANSGSSDTSGVFTSPACDKPSWFLKQAEAVFSSQGENQLREGAARSALSYLGCAYRWGGKSPLGIDCSGLTFMSWMEQGILIYRDAHIKDKYPVREISRDELKKGDLIFFPGHVGMYLENDRFVHATGYAASFCVCVSSLNPSDPDYRADLAGNISMCGSVIPVDQ